MAKKRDKTSSVIKLRFLVSGLLILSAILVLPLILVWKQAYINSAALELEEMSGTLSALKREIATLRLQCEQLSNNARIERIARTALNLEYPASSQITIVPLRGGFAGNEGQTSLRISSIFGTLFSGAQ